MKNLISWLKEEWPAVAIFAAVMAFAPVLAYLHYEVDTDVRTTCREMVGGTMMVTYYAPSLLVYLGYALQTGVMFGLTILAIKGMPNIFMYGDESVQDELVAATVAPGMIGLTLLAPLVNVLLSSTAGAFSVETMKWSVVISAGLSAFCVGCVVIKWVVTKSWRLISGSTCCSLA